MKKQQNQLEHYFYRMLFCLLGAVCLVGCSDKEVSGIEQNTDADKLKMVFNVILPNGQNGRSTTRDPEDDYVTSDDGIEIGKDYENHVGEVLLVLADQSDKCLMARTATMTTNNDAQLWEVESKASDIEGFGEVNVYVFCNPSEELKNIKKGDDLATMKYTLNADSKTDPAWNKDGKHFFMSNAVPHSYTFKGIIPEDRTYDLGTVKVERSVARFDYKAKNASNLYDIMLKGENSDTETKDPEYAGIQIQLTDVALINMSKSFYYLRRVSNNGLNDNATICGTEVSNNYVVDTDAAFKEAYNSDDSNDKASYFHYNLEKPNEWKNTFSSLADIANNEEDEDEEWNDPNEHGKYHIWRYATENTIPQPDTHQKNGISTGVVFKGQVVVAANANSSLAKKLKGDGGKWYRLYAFKGRLYGSWTDVQNAAQHNAELSASVQAVESKSVSLREAGFSVFYPQYLDAAKTKIGYQVLYYYWNRHNDNGRTTGPNHMGPMEFAVVRNNVYKLCVEQIYTFGYAFNDEGPDPDPDPENPDPEDPDPDPEHPDPDTSDEPDPSDDPEVTFKVSVKVLPWVVRINNIEF